MGGRRERTLGYRSIGAKKMSLMRDYLCIPRCNGEASVTLGALRPNVGGPGEGRRAKGWRDTGDYLLYKAYKK
ncbi:hypothetical protein M407DRAFT_128864 [Tulasnella calospora MUT 4182]|uniref:Uncharacterized protein n=1 Tax=Tulasnella calospora MUT 4182 TaxID=1051891 RepID=A0A0C3QRZ8_9AGAM|nr:hypothetical protein M407DRAFT_128864 [Tulasnella calospora MUT 4182]